MPSTVIRAGKIARWGNSAAVRILTAALERTHLRVDDAVDVTVREDEMVSRRRLTMDQLLAKFDPASHRHDLAFDGDDHRRTRPEDGRTFKMAD